MRHFSYSALHKFCSRLQENNFTVPENNQQHSYSQQTMNVLVLVIGIMQEKRGNRKRQEVICG